MVSSVVMNFLNTNKLCHRFYDSARKAFGYVNSLFTLITSLALHLTLFCSQLYRVIHLVTVVLLKLNRNQQAEKKRERFVEGLYNISKFWWTMVVQASYFCHIHTKINIFCMLKIVDSELLLQRSKISKFLPNYAFFRRKKELGHSYY